MFRLFRKSWRTGVVTEPAHATAPAPPTLRGLPLLNPAACEASGLCVQVCPTGAIELVAGDGKAATWTLDDTRCIFCGYCVEVCPTKALAASGRYRLAKTSKEREGVSLPVRKKRS